MELWKLFAKWFGPRCDKTGRSCISGPVVQYIVAIDVTQMHFGVAFCFKTDSIRQKEFQIPFARMETTNAHFEGLF